MLFLIFMAATLRLQSAAAPAPDAGTKVGDQHPPIQRESPLASGAGSAATTPALELGETLDRQSLIDAVVSRNPSLEAARQAYRAAALRSEAVSGLEQPTLSYSMSPLSLGGGSRFGQRLRYGQRLPFPGRREERAEVAAATAEVHLHQFEELLLELTVEASDLLDEYRFLTRAREINDQHRELVETFQRVATARYAAGTAPQQAPLQAEVESAHLDHQDVVLATRIGVTVARINALLHRDPWATLPAPGALKVDDLSIPEMPDELVERALAGRPELRALDAEIEARIHEVSLRELDFRPDFEVFGEYNSMWGETEHRWMVGAGVNLPIFRKRLRAARAEAQARVGESRSELRARRDAIGREVELARLELVEARHVLELYESRLLPAAGDQVRAALAGFESGQNSFLALIDAERSQRRLELEYERARADFSRRRVELDRAVGRAPAGYVTVAQPMPGGRREHEGASP